MNKEDCYICKELKEKERYELHGSWTTFAIEKDDGGKYCCFAYGEGIVSIPCNYCPNCGRKIEND